MSSRYHGPLALAVKHELVKLGKTKTVTAQGAPICFPWGLHEPAVNQLAS